MEQFFADLVARTADIPPLWAYGLILLITWMENVLPPIPGDLIVVFGGYLVATGLLEIVPVVVISTMGGAIGFMCMYYLGWHAGVPVLDSRFMRWIPHEPVGRVRAWMQRWGYGVVAANRFLSGARSVISLTVGISRMPPWPVAAFATLSALVWTSLIAGLGYAVGEEWERIMVYLGRYGKAVSVMVGTFLAWQLFRAIKRSRRRSSKATLPHDSSL